MKKAYSALPLFVLFVSLAVCAKDESQIILRWPADNPSIKLTFGKFKQIYSQAGQNTYVTDVTVENLTDKAFAHILFTVYLMDKSKVRIGDGQLQVSDIGPSQQVKVPFQVSSVGVPSSLSLSAKRDMLAGKTIPMKIISVPPGAKLKVDGQDVGITPVMVRLTVGSHTLAFSKEGYSPGSTPLEITPDELPGGSISFEMGGLSRDTVELRDGSVLQGDVLSVSMTSVVMRIEGKDQTYGRNQVRKIMLVEREIMEQPPVSVPQNQIQPVPKQ